MSQAVVDVVGNDKFTQILKGISNEITNLKNQFGTIRGAATNSMSGVSNEFNTLKTNTTSAKTEVQSFKSTLDTVKSSGSGAAQGVKEVDQATGNLKTRLSSVGSAMTGLIANIGTFSMSIVNLMRQYRDLEDTQIRVEATQRKASTSAEALTKAKEKLAEAEDKNGKSSKEYKQALLDVEQAELAAGVASKNHEEALEAQSDAYQNFYLSIIPNVVSAVGILVGTFTSLKAASLGAQGGIGGITGAGGGLMKFLGPLGLILAGITAAIIAIKTNAFGFRDFLTDIGARLGDAMPFLKPFLTFLQDIGIILGIMPGNADLARTSIGAFFESIKTWFTEMGATVQKFFGLLTSLDIAGAFALLKESIDKALPGLTDTISEFFKDPVGVTIDLFAQTVNWIKTAKWGDWTIEQWWEAIRAMFKVDLERLGFIPAVINIVANLAAPIIGPINRDVYKRMGELFAEEYKRDPVPALINLFTRIVDFTIASLLPEDIRKFYLKFADEWDDTKGQNVAKIIVDAVVSGVNNLGFETPTSVGNFVNQVQDLFKKIPPISVSPPLALLAALLPEDTGAKIDKWISDTFTLDNLNKGFEQISSTLQTAGSNAVNWIFKGMTEFSTTQLDPFINSLFKLETWTKAFDTAKAEIGKIGEALFKAIFNPETEEAVGDAGKKLTGIGKGILNAVLETDWSMVGKSIIAGIGNWFTTNLPESSESFIGMVNSMGLGLSTAAAKIPTGLIDFAKAFIVGLAGALAEAPEAFQTLMDAIWTELKKKFPVLGFFDSSGKEGDGKSSGAVYRGDDGRYYDSNGNLIKGGGNDGYHNARFSLPPGFMAANNPKQGLNTAIGDAATLSIEGVIRYLQEGNWGQKLIDVLSGKTSADAYRALKAPTGGPTSAETEGFGIGQTPPPNAATAEQENAMIGVTGAGLGPANPNDILARQLNQIDINTKALIATNNIYAKTVNQIKVNTTALVTSNNLFARTLNQLAINTRALITTNNLFARTLNQINVNSRALVTTNNLFARTVNQLTINVRALISTNNTFARTLVQVNSNSKTLIATNNTLARTFVQLTKNVKAYTDALNDIPKKVSTTLEIKTKKVQAAAGFAGWVPFRTQFEVAENEPEFVVAIPQSRFSESDINQKVQAQVQERGQKIRNKVINRLEERGIDVDRFERLIRMLMSRPIQITVMTPDRRVIGEVVQQPLTEWLGAYSG